MIITLRRPLARCTPQYTPGSMAIDAVIRWVTLEDPLLFDPTAESGDFDARVNYPRRTCIPFGWYEMALTHSKKFGCLMPLVMNVPGRSGIRVHIVNTAEDVEGCIGVGKEAYPGRIERSREAFGEFMGVFVSAVSLGKVYLNVIPEFAPPPTGS